MRISSENRRLSGTMTSLVLGSLTLIGCGGGSSGGGTGNVTASGLLPEAAGCQYLLDQNLGITAAQLNADGCAYTGSDGKVAYWAGTNGTFGPGFNTAGNGLNPPSTTTGSTTTGTTTTGSTTTGTTTSGGGSTTSGGSTTAGGVQFPAVTAIPANLADGDSGSAMYRDAPNSSILAGPVFGSDNLSGSALRKSVPFIVNMSDTNISIEHILAVERPGLALSELVFYIRNSGSTTHCFVKFEGIEVRDNSGSVIQDAVTLDFGFVEGTANYFSNSGITTNTCISAGDTVYLTKRINTDITGVGGIVIDNLARSTSTSNIDLAMLVEAVSYSVDGNDLNVTLANRSVVTADVPFINLVGLDASGLPVGSTLTTGPELAPGEEATITFSAGFSSAMASTARIIIDYEAVAE